MDDIEFHLTALLMLSLLFVSGIVSWMLFRHGDKEAFSAPSLSALKLSGRIASDMAHERAALWHLEREVAEARAAQKADAA
ncbi:hypothetical protein JMK10_02145 [Rhodovulum sulfidophilum]|uniref:hypothetical protein n=1 Tax=Rhodovulum sulfidophilum TaxID=35806 RepID=UPI0019224D89|nr:hypothetical protein [Rhodovulum sulfidophilum]MBL3574279.1 hypothetical protein [Rhodovulum sulfidophilum]MCE8433442.1 hypothetical protein [Rhodovulum sulfidophilum]MCF4115644.1 hypothetical protein [Rhodovulum sulfidophilum]